MAQRVESYVRVGTNLVNVYYPSHIKGVVGLLYGTKIDKNILPTATSSDLGAVKVSDTYAPGTPATDTALSQAGAKALYQKIQNLESPLDYISSLDREWGSSTTQSTINTNLNSIANSFGVTPGPGSAFLIYNWGSGTPVTYYEYQFNPSSQAELIKDYWLWVFDGTNWLPAIDFPDIPHADYSGVTESAMIEGIITKAMLWKLKNIEAGAQVNTVTSVAGKTGAVTLSKGDVELSNVPNIDATNASNIGSGTLSADRLAASGVSAGTYKSVTVDTKGRVTGGTNPTTLSGYGITDATPSSHIGSTGAAHGTASGSVAGFMSAAHYTKLQDLGTGSETNEGVLQLANSVEAQAATITSKATSPARVKEIVDKYATTKIYTTMPAYSDVPDGNIFLYLVETIA